VLFTERTREAFGRVSPVGWLLGGTGPSGLFTLGRFVSVLTRTAHRSASLVPAVAVETEIVGILQNAGTLGR
jgi:hypothetical protein